MHVDTCRVQKIMWMCHKCKTQTCSDSEHETIIKLIKILNQII